MGNISRDSKVGPTDPVSLARPRTETFPDTWVMTGIVMGLELVTVGIGKTCEEDLSASSIHCMLASPQAA